MGSRHLQTLIAVFISGLWVAAVYFAHERGHLGFLDRIESAMTDLRTLARGVRVPPDFVTIVAIDDTMVEQGGSYPLARIDLARIVDAIARLQPKVIAIDLLLVDRGSDDGDEALARSLAGRASVIAAAAVFAQASQPIAAENGPLARLPRWRSARNPPSSPTVLCSANDRSPSTPITRFQSLFTARAEPCERSARPRRLPARLLRMTSGSELLLSGPRSPEAVISFRPRSIR